jgi:hypothetical protein
VWQTANRFWTRGDRWRIAQANTTRVSRQTRLDLYAIARSVPSPKGRGRRFGVPLLMRPMDMFACAERENTI